MKLVSFTTTDGEEVRLGALLGDDIVDLRLAGEAMGADGEVQAREWRDWTMEGLLEGGAKSFSLTKRTLEWAANGIGDDSDYLVRGEDARLAPPLARPGKVVCVGLNYLDHIEEVGRPIPEVPTLFCKPSSTVVGTGQTIEYPRISEQLDFEVELAVVIGSRAKRVSEQDAREHVFGYTVLNDISVRDYQRLTGQWFAGKAFDTTCPMGPAIVTADEMPDPHSLEISCRVNGETRQVSNTSNLRFKVDQLVSYISQIMTLEAGDVIATGTPGGVALGEENPRWLKPGDRLESSISGIGTLVNTVGPSDREVL